MIGQRPDPARGVLQRADALQVRPRPVQTVLNFTYPAFAAMRNRLLGLAQASELHRPFIHLTDGCGATQLPSRQQTRPHKLTHFWHFDSHFRSLWPNGCRGSGHRHSSR